MTPDAQVALCNRIMRERVAPALPPGYVATLIVFQTKADGLTTYISGANRASMRSALRELLEKWDAEAAARGEG